MKLIQSDSYMEKFILTLTHSLYKYWLQMWEGKKYFRRGFSMLLLKSGEQNILDVWCHRTDSLLIQTAYKWISRMGSNKSKFLFKTTDSEMELDPRLQVVHLQKYRRIFLWSLICFFFNDVRILVIKSTSNSC